MEVFRGWKKQFEAQASNTISNNHSQGRSPFWVKSPGQSNSASEEKAFAVFQSDILIPEQFLATYQRTFRLDPEKLLMLAVLQDAVTCFPGKYCSDVQETSGTLSGGRRMVHCR